MSVNPVQTTQQNDSGRRDLYCLENLRFAFETKPAVQIDGLAFEQRQIHALAGPNGSGKSTLLRILNGLLLPQFGAVMYRGVPAARDGYARVRRESVLVHQDPYLFDGTVFQNLAFGLRIRNYSAQAIRAKVAEKLALLGLAGFEQRKARTLSGGEIQRAAIARALVIEPRVLLLDEPTANVDPSTVPLLEVLARRLLLGGTTVILSSHNLGFAYRVGTRHVFLEGGEVVPVNVNIFKGRLEKSDDRFSYFGTGNQVLRCPAQEGAFETAVLALDDVILSRKEITTSAQNQFAGTVTALEKMDHTVRVALDCGFAVQALVTEYSVDTMNIVVGSHFYVTFKASAIRLY